MTWFAAKSQGQAFAGGLACIGAAALIIALGAAQIRDREAAGGAQFTLEVPDASTIGSVGGSVGGPAGEDDIPMPEPAGGATPAGTTERADSAAQAAPAAGPAELQPDQANRSPAASPPPAAAPVALARPIVLAAGRFSFGGKVLELDRIVPVSVNRQCTDTSGEGWPCGRMARTAFANLVRGRTIDCEVPAADWSGTAIARCTLAGKDLSQWLVENGWAEAQPGSPLTASAETARRAGLGLFSPDPRRRKTKSQDTTSPENPMSDSQQP
ncbi:thermonuclease family protein [Mycoplana ramosa]|uniref:Thermonuclease family protein n=1 Tax=Mycoplana ramosa TaxID=40837 RepID=A0ABW3YWJ9_MYCRA